jgi:hypothetical protein
MLHETRRRKRLTDDKPACIEGSKEGSAQFGFLFSSKRLAFCLVFGYGLLDMVL